MKHLPFKFGSLGIALLVLFLFSIGFANDFSDFEKLLQEAIRANQTSGDSESSSAGTTEKTGSTPAKKTADPSAKQTQPAPNPGSPAKSTPAKTAKPASPTKANGTNVQSAETEDISEGWTTVQPNDPGTVFPEPLVVRPPATTATQAPQTELFSESDGVEEPVELFEPDPIKTDAGKSSDDGEPSESLALDSIFEEEHTVIHEEDEINVIESAPELKESELETITEPKRVNESRGTTSEPPEEKSGLSATLEDLAKETLEDELTDTSGTPEDAATQPEPTQVVVSVPDFDSEDDETVWKVIKADTVGDPHAQDKLKLMYDEVINGLRTRNITNRYDMWKNFSKGILRDTAGINTNSELDGRCRLKWYEKLYAEPVRSTFDAEEYSRELFAGFSGEHRHLAELMPGIRDRMGVSKRESGDIKFPLCSTPMEALVEVKRCLLAAASAHAQAFASLTPAELTELNKAFVETFVGKGCVNGHTIPARSVGRKHVDIMDRANKAALYDGAEALIPLTNTALLDLLLQLPDDALPQVMMSGQKFQRLTTAAGDIIIGGRGKNSYDLDSPEMREVICVISRGEDDSFREGTCNMNRPVMVIIAMGKKNTFVGKQPGIQGGSVMGISMLLDRSEFSTYSAEDVAQGSTMGGVGILINYSGTNHYKALRRVQGHALEGLGMLIDRGKGNATYKASLWAQGFGAPNGFGVLSNSGGGNNHYYCGGYYPDSYPEHPGYDGWGQGIGAGIRQVANGGIGVILSGTGDDVYEVDYFGHGGGYWLGVGIARDFGGSDIRYGTTITTYDGRPRPGPGVQARWTRFANGFGCHYALGFCFDDGGNDVYGGQIMGTGMAWDLSYGVLCDFNGSGKYTATGNMTQGVGAEASIGILFSYGGNDTFASRSQGLASSNVTYHPPASGGNFSFLINYGGENTYGSKVARHSYAQRGSAGFVIDRPTETEAASSIVALRQAVETRNKEIAEYDAMVAQMKEEARERRQPYRGPRQRRPTPISESQLIGAVPDFDPNIRKADAPSATVK
ncbi:MAG: hypothetical protein LBI05_04035 [Planctomycetaceae bacterium]|nr:hypothetical protein [Planctomycetaceae bacterium]